MAMDERLRILFRTVNRVTVPMVRAGFGPLIGNPFSGYFMVLTTTGRRSGLPRHVPLNYAIVDGNVYCISGFGRDSHWLANIRADPHVEVRLPDRRLRGTASEVTDEAEAVRAARGALIAAGFVGWAYGNPRRIPDAELVERSDDMPVVRITPTGVVAGPADPGGRLWLLPLAALAVAAAGRLVGRNAGPTAD